MSITSKHFLTMLRQRGSGREEEIEGLRRVGGSGGQRRVGGSGGVTGVREESGG